MLTFIYHGFVATFLPPGQQPDAGKLALLPVVLSLAVVTISLISSLPTPVILLHPCLFTCMTWLTPLKALYLNQTPKVGKLERFQ
jgi:hypothetical protein